MLCLLFVLTLGNAELMCPSLLWESWFDCGNNVAPDAFGCCPDGGCPPGCRSAAWTCCPRVCTCTGCPYARKPLLQAMTIQDQWVKAHNYFRCRHGNAPLAWNTQVATNAYNWANVGSGCNVYHSDSGNNFPPSGENIMEGFVNPFDAVSWMYSEIAYYTPNSGEGECSAVCGHYTAMIWNSTTALGCGTCASKKYDVCQYALSPPNYNADTQAPLNVPRSNTPIFSENECCNRIFAPACPIDITLWGTWPSTQPNVLASMNCPPAYLGIVRRTCGHDGIWQDVDSTGCTPVMTLGESCPIDITQWGTWPSTLPNALASMNCPPGYIGIVHRTCSSNGIWQDVDSTGCISAIIPGESCPIDTTQWGTWPSTLPNALASMNCPPGYVGTVHRTCSSNGIWQDVDSTGCTELIASESFKDCPIDVTMWGIWPATAPNIMTNMHCPLGDLDGIVHRTCGANGVWQDVDFSECTEGSEGGESNEEVIALGENCPSDITDWGTWSSTPPNSLASMDCPPGYIGAVRRTCAENGHWQPVDTTGCTETFFLMP